jgi:antitoxin FitA
MADERGPHSRCFRVSVYEDGRHVTHTRAARPRGDVNGAPGFAIIDSVSRGLEAFVAQLIVRNVDDDLVRRLKRRAAEHGRSAEEEHRQLLRSALRSDGLLDRLMEMPDAGLDADFVRADDMPRNVEL